MTSKDAYREFFLEPEITHHRRYEMLRAYFLEGKKPKILQVSSASVTFLFIR